MDEKTEKLMWTTPAVVRHGPLSELTKSKPKQLGDADDLIGGISTSV